MDKQILNREINIFKEVKQVEVIIIDTNLYIYIFDQILLIILLFLLFKKKICN